MERKPIEEFHQATHLKSFSKPFPFNKMGDCSILFLLFRSSIRHCVHSRTAGRLQYHSTAPCLLEAIDKYYLALCSHEPPPFLAAEFDPGIASHC